MSELNQEHVDIVVAGFEKSDSDDTILEALFNAGVGFSDLRSTFNDIIKEKGLRLSAKDRKAKTAAFLEGWTPEAEDTSGMLGKVAALQVELNVPTTKAMTEMRAWAKENEITLPKKPKAVKAKKVGFGGVVKQILDHAMANQDCTRDDLVKFCKENDIKEAYAGSAYNAVEFARNWNAPVEAETEVEAEAESA